MILILLILLFASPAWATTYWTAATGGSAAGSCAAASGTSDPSVYQRTVVAGVACLSAGDTLIIKSGTYVESINSTMPSGSSTSARTTIRANTGDTVILRPTVCLGETGNVITLNNKSNVLIYGLVPDAINCGGQGIYAHGSGSGIRIERNEIKNALGAGNCVTIQGTQTNSEVVDNKIHDCGVSVFEHGVYVWNTGHLIEHNEIYNIAGYGIHLYFGAQGVSNNTIRYNYVRNFGTVGGAGILLGSGSGNIAHHNIVTAGTSSYGGITIRYNSGGSANYVYNNTIYNNSGPCLSAYTAVSPTFINNVCVDNGTNEVSDGGGNSGIVSTTNTFSTDEAVFINVANLQFSPRESSALIDAGTNISGFSSGKFVGSAPDRGALEAPIYFSASIEDGDASRVRVQFSLPTQGVRDGTGIQNCVATDFVVVLNSTTRTSTNCVITGSNGAWVTFNGAAASAGQVGTVAYTRGAATGVYDNMCWGSALQCRNAEVRTFSAQSITNNVSGAGAQAWAVTSFKCFDWYGSVASPTFYPSGIAENTPCKVMYGGKVAQIVNIACTGANCDPTSFEWKWALNGGAKSSLTDSAASNLIAFSNTAPNISDNQSIASAIITDPHGSFVAGRVVGQQATQPTVDLTQNSSTQVILLMQANAVAAVGDSYCIYPERTGGTAITYTQTPCFSIVNPAGGTPY